MNATSEQWSAECMEALRQADVAWLCQVATNPPSHPWLPSPGLACLMAMLYTQGVVAYEHSPPKLTLWTGFLTLHRPKGWTR